MEEDTEVIFDGFFGYVKRNFCAEKIPVSDLAMKYGTPCFVYSRNSLLSRIEKFKEAFGGVDSLICYSVKANSNLSLLKIMKENDFGADVVSGGELHRALLAGFKPRNIVFAGVGKRDDEIEMGVRKGIGYFNIENEEELRIIEAYGRKYKRKVLCNIRLNLDIDVDTHHYIKTSKKETKFGIDLCRAAEIIKKNRKSGYVDIRGFHLHLGSQLKEVTPYLEALDKVEEFCRAIGFKSEIIDIGGGFGIAYSPSDTVKDIGSFGKQITDKIRKMGVKRLILEPGRYIAGNIAVLLTRVLYVKKRQEKNFVIIDAGMNDIVRPAFYGSYHAILPAKASVKSGKAMRADVVGPICETGDYLGKNVELPGSVKAGDLLVIASAGAYCFSMSSNYNSRLRPCEVLVNGRKSIVIRKRESFADLVKHEI